MPVTGIGGLSGTRPKGIPVRKGRRLRRSAEGFATQNRSRKGFNLAVPDKMTNLVTNLETRTDEELKNALARLLAYASGEVLTEAEVQTFRQLHEEVRRRSPFVTAA